MQTLRGNKVYYHSDFMKSGNETLLKDFLRKSDEMTKTRVLVHKKRGACKDSKGNWVLYLELTESAGE